MVKTSKEASELTEEEAAKRRDKIARRMLNTPPKPHKSKQAKNSDSRRKLSPKKRD